MWEHSSAMEESMPAPVGVKHSSSISLLLSIVKILSFSISRVAGAGTGKNPWAHFITPEPVGTGLIMHLSIFKLV